MALLAAVAVGIVAVLLGGLLSHNAAPAAASALSKSSPLVVDALAATNASGEGAPAPLVLPSTSPITAPSIHDAARADDAPSDTATSAAPQSATDGTFEKTPLGNEKNLRPVVLLPGFASSRLRAWSFKECHALQHVEPGTNVWVSIEMILLAKECWLACMRLCPEMQTDNAKCRLRADEGMDGITQV
jgi:hypothetical protein